MKKGMKWITVLAAFVSVGFLPRSECSVTNDDCTSCCLRLTDDQVTELMENHKQLIEDMGGKFLPELLSMKKYFLKDLLPSLSHDQEQKALECYPSIFRPREELLSSSECHVHDNGKLDNLECADTLWPRENFLSSSEEPDKSKSRCSKTSSPICPSNEYLVNLAVTSYKKELACIVHLSNHVQGVRNNNCRYKDCQGVFLSGKLPGDCCCCSKTNTVSALVFTANNPYAVQRNVITELCEASICK